ncbi:hypothetical protein A9K81_20480 [Pseudomonas syringae pv. syringae]|nr:hypothetical protein A9K81_20480 [Pseudomonas syringae pv. syringae]
MESNSATGRKRLRRISLYLTFFGDFSIIVVEFVLHNIQQFVFNKLDKVKIDFGGCDACMSKTVTNVNEWFDSNIHLA